MGHISNPFKSGQYSAGESLVSDHTLFWHHLAPARKLIESLKPIDLEIGETKADDNVIWFWKIAFPEVTSALSRLREQAIEDEVGYPLQSVQSALYGLKQQAEAAGMNNVEFAEQAELDYAQERVDRYLLVQSVVPSVQRALMEQFGDPNEWKSIGLEAANERWELEPMALQPEPQLLYNRAADTEKPSSNIERVEYDATNSILVVSFTNQSMYRYFDVPPNVAEGLKRARSKGTFLNLAVKQGGYRFERFG